MVLPITSLFNTSLLEMRAAIAVGNALHAFGASLQMQSSLPPAPSPTLNARFFRPLGEQLMVMAVPESIETLTPEQVAAFSPDQKLRVVEEMFDVVDEIRTSFTVRFVAAVQTKTSKNLHPLNAWIQSRVDWVRNIEQAIRTQLGEESQEGKLFAHYSSSYWQPLCGLRNGMAAMTDAQRLQPETFLASQLATLFMHVPRKEHTFLDHKGYWTSEAKSELAGCVCSTFFGNAYHKEWNGTRLHMQLSLARSAVQDSRGYRLFDSISWPLSIDDVAIQSFARILGWKFASTEKDDELVVTIDFGEHFLDTSI
ncbi:MAG: hypothetical protein HY540_06885 [Deltaproteobacteria bacterium]|nr:hypothetical protein [Deltaproteobacteria bacterium]